MKSLAHDDYQEYLASDSLSTQKSVSLLQEGALVFYLLVNEIAILNPNLSLIQRPKENLPPR
jgi:hypothetical protein